MCCVSMLWKTQHAVWICPFFFSHCTHATELDWCHVSAWIQLLLTENSHQEQGLSWRLKAAQDWGASSIRGFEQKTHRFKAKWMDQASTWDFPCYLGDGLFGWCQSFVSPTWWCVSNLPHVLCLFSSAVEIKGSWKREWGVNKRLVPL